MSKRKVEVIPSSSNIVSTTVLHTKITEVQEDFVIVEISGAKQLIPVYRFIKESDKANLFVGASVKLNYYYGDSSKKRLLAYNAELN